LPEVLLTKILQNRRSLFKLTCRDPPDFLWSSNTKLQVYE